MSYRKYLMQSDISPSTAYEATAVDSDNDTISRAKAIDAVKRLSLGETDAMKLAMRIGDYLERLSPAQPERTPMQELLDTTADRDYWKAQCHSYEMTINRLTESAQPERIKGHWIENNGLNILMKKFIEKGETWRVCDKCGAGFMIGYQYECDKLYHETFHNFCPNCGADMRGEQDE